MKLTNAEGPECRRSGGGAAVSRRHLLCRSGAVLGSAALLALFGEREGAAAGTVPKYLSAEASVGPYELPDLLKKAGGGSVTRPEEWPAQRQAILELFRTHVYGRSPGRPERLSFETVEKNSAALDGKATLKRVAIRCGQGDRNLEFQVTLFLPNGRRPAPVFLLLNNRPPENTDPTRAKKSGFWPAEEIIARGYGAAAIQLSDLSPDKPDRFREGAIRLKEGDRDQRPPDAWKTISAWAWGASRVMDYFETDPAIDTKRIAVIGHSRGGKTALWAGAQDERFALTISNCSGCTGAALARRPVGEDIKKINTGFPHWFCDNYRRYNDRDAELPVDQHMLIALMAPRAVYVASAEEDLWADPKGEFLGLAHASPAFALFGQPGVKTDAMPGLEMPLISGRQGYHIRHGIHNLTPYDWQRDMDFADHLWKG